MSSWTCAYNTNGFAHHRLHEALEVLAEIGYGGVALTLDVHHLDPFGRNFEEELARTAELLTRLKLSTIVESGARFNLDPRHKHFPGLLSRRRRGERQAWIERCLEAARALGAGCVGLWSGRNFDELGVDQAYEALAEGLKPLVERAEELGVDLAFEPEPGMFVDTVDGYERLKAMLPSSRFGLALDTGHLLVTQECGIPEAIRRFRGEILSVAVEDMRRGVHEHLPFGEGDVDFPPLFAALDEIGYRGLVAVELPRSSPDAVRVAEASFRFLATHRR